jgi:hypothetical protein
MTEKQNTSQGSERKGIKHAAWGIGFVLVFVLVFGAVVRLLWNWLMPEIFALRAITYLQAIGLLLLSRLLFGRVGQRRDHAGYLTGKYGFRSLFGRGGQETSSSDATEDR